MPNVAKTENGLTPMQSRFVDCLVSNGGKKTQAAKDAGYSERTARTRAYELFRNENVQAVIAKRSDAQIKSHIPLAIGVIKDLALYSKSDSVRLQAAQDILNRAGMRPKQEVHVNHTLTTKEQYKAILIEIRQALESQPIIDVNPIDAVVSD